MKGFGPLRLSADLPTGHNLDFTGNDAEYPKTNHGGRQPPGQTCWRHPPPARPLQLQKKGAAPRLRGSSFSGHYFDFAVSSA
jgi:hypothetical protein